MVTRHFLLFRWVQEYVDKRKEWLAEIMRIHGVDEKTAKRLPNILMYGGGYETWLDDNDLPYLPRQQWFRKVLALKHELLQLRATLFHHPRFKAMVDAERERAVRDVPAHSVDASLMSRIARRRTASTPASRQPYR